MPWVVEAPPSPLAHANLKFRGQKDLTLWTPRKETSGDLPGASPGACGIHPGSSWHPTLNGVSMTAPRFVHDDIVRLVHGEQIGTVKEVHQTDTGYRYVIELRTDTAQYVEVPEAELELLKIGNADETGLHIRYIT